MLKQIRRGFDLLLVEMRVCSHHMLIASYASTKLVISTSVPVSVSCFLLIKIHPYFSPSQPHSEFGCHLFVSITWVPLNFTCTPKIQFYQITITHDLVRLGIYFTKNCLVIVIYVTSLSHHCFSYFIYKHSLFYFSFLPFWNQFCVLSWNIKLMGMFFFICSFISNFSTSY
jgi:hypothetical protein